MRETGIPQAGYLFRQTFTKAEAGVGLHITGPNPLLIRRDINPSLIHASASESAYPVGNGLAILVSEHELWRRIYKVYIRRVLKAVAPLYCNLRLSRSLYYDTT